MENHIVLSDNNQQEFLENFFDYMIERYGKDERTLQDLKFGKEAFLNQDIGKINEFVITRIPFMSGYIRAEFQLALFDVKIDGKRMIDKIPITFHDAHYQYSPTRDYYYSDEEIKARIRKVSREDNVFTDALVKLYGAIAEGQIVKDEKRIDFDYQTLLEDCAFLIQVGSTRQVKSSDSFMAADRILNQYMDNRRFSEEEQTAFYQKFGKALMDKFNAEGWAINPIIYETRFVDRKIDEMTYTEILDFYSQPAIKKHLVNHTEFISESFSRLQKAGGTSKELFEFMTELLQEKSERALFESVAQTVARFIRKGKMQEELLDFEVSMPLLENCIGDIAAMFEGETFVTTEIKKAELEFFAGAGDKELLREKIKEKVTEYHDIGVILPSTYEDIAKEFQKYNPRFTVQDLKEGVKNYPNVKQIIQTIDQSKAGHTRIQDFDLQKLGKIYSKTRLAYLPLPRELKYLSDKEVENFDLKTWNQFLTVNAFSKNEQSEKALMEMIDVLGLFEKDKDVAKRRGDVYKLVSSQHDPSFKEIVGSLIGEKVYNLLEARGLEGEVKSHAVKLAKREGGQPDLSKAVYDLYFEQYDEKYYNNFTTAEIPNEFGAILNHNTLALYSEEYFRVIKNMKGNFGKRINDYLFPYAKQGDEFVLKRGIVIPEELQGILQEKMNAKDFERIKNAESTDDNLLLKASGFIAPFKEEVKKRIRIKNNLPREIQDIIIGIDKDVWFNRKRFNYYDAHAIFDGFDRVYKPDFCKFFIENFNFIIESEKVESQLKFIHRDWERIIEFYKVHGNSEPNYFDIINYFDNISFASREGNEIFAETVKKAGVSSQQGFDFYQNLLPKLKDRKVTTLPRHDKIYDYRDKNGKEYKVMTKILRVDDPMTMLVGESKFSNCCQTYNGAGQNCMEHAATSKDGGILAVYLIGDDGVPQMMTQSWTWTRESKLCLDNVEATNLITSKSGAQKRLYQDIATFGLICAAQDMLKSSKVEVEKYIQQKIAEIDRKQFSPEEKEEELKKLEELRQRQTLKIITVGEGYDDLNVRETFPEIDSDSNGPKGYHGYRDSKEGQQHIIAKAEGKRLEVDESYQDVPLYRDNRRVMHQKGEGITNETLQRIYEIEKASHKAEMVMYSREGVNLITNAKFLAEITECNINELNVIIGEDWYYVYSDDGKVIDVADFAKSEPRFEDEANLQQQEMNKAFDDILAQSVVIKEGKLETLKSISADLREDTSYLLYLYQKKRGRVEQVGEDKRYSFNNSYYKEDVTEEMQAEILKNNKQIRKQGNEDCKMHQVTFIPTEITIKKLVEENLAKLDERSL